MLIAITLYVCWIDNKSWNLIYASSLYVILMQIYCMDDMKIILIKFIHKILFQHDAENVVIGQ